MYMSVPCSDTYVPIYQFMSMWSGFQMMMYKIIEIEMYRYVLSTYWFILFYDPEYVPGTNFFLKYILKIKQFRSSGFLPTYDIVCRTYDIV